MYMGNVDNSKTRTNTGSTTLPMQAAPETGRPVVSTLPLTPAGYPHRTLSMLCAGACGERYTALLRCGDRTCTFCRERDYWRLLLGYCDSMPKKTPDGAEIRFLTLTIRNIMSNDVDTIREAVKTMQAAFGRMRRRKAYRRLIYGGLTGTELKYTPAAGWNLHLHILYAGEYLLLCCDDMKKANTAAEISGMEKNVCPGCPESVCIRRDWKKASGNNPVVHIKRMWSLRSGVEYILKYLTKSPDLNGQVRAYNDIVAGCRLVQTFGCWWKVKLVRRRLVCPICGGVKWVNELWILHCQKYATPIRPPPMAAPAVVSVVVEIDTQENLNL